MALTSDITKNETIIVTGCSYTTQPYNTAPSYNHEKVTINNTWSTYIQCKKMINVAECGRGNYAMIKHALAYIYANPNEKIDRVIVALSGWQRFYTPKMNFTGTAAQDYWTHDKEEIQEKLDATERGQLSWGHDGFNKLRLHRHELIWHYEFGPPSKNEIVQMIKDTCISLNNLYHVCIVKNIKLHVFQMLPAWPWPLRKTDEYEMLASTNYEELTQISTLYDIFRENKADIYGFPFMQELGGEWLWRHCSKDKKYWIPDDGHPNELGHKLLYEKIIESLNDFEL